MVCAHKNPSPTKDRSTEGGPAAPDPRPRVLLRAPPRFPGEPKGLGLVCLQTNTGVDGVKACKSTWHLAADATLTLIVILNLLEEGK